MKLRIAILAGLLAGLITPAAQAHSPQRRAPYPVTLSNTQPLAFGMTAAETADVLGVPLAYVKGSRGNEMFVAPRPSNGYFARHARLWLQFRNNRLTGWKGDWERNWMWD